MLLVDPEYNIKTDTLLYNTYTFVATFVVPTVITSDSGREKLQPPGRLLRYKNKKVYFGKRPQIQDRSTFLTAQWSPVMIQQDSAKQEAMLFIAIPPKT